MYADDLYIIQKGCDKSELQDTIDRLELRLGALGLIVNGEKCRVMVVKFGINVENINREKRFGNAFTIDGRPIKLVESMKILGMHMTWRMLVDRMRIKDLIKKSLLRLCDIYNQDIIHDAREWRLIIDSILNSRLVINHWPLLVTDPNSRSWIDNIYCKVMKILFNWPSNITNKCIRLITKQSSCVTHVEKTIRLGITRESSNTFEALKKLLDRSQTPGLSRKECLKFIEHQPKPLIEQLDMEHLRYGNPEHYLSNSHVVEIDDRNYIYSILIEILRNGHSLWLMPKDPACISSKRGAMAIELDREGMNVIRRLIVKHAAYPITYFSTFSLLWKMFTDNMASISGRVGGTVVMDKKSAVVAALKNNKNRDWRVIELRRALVENNWRIVLMDRLAIESRLIDPHPEISATVKLWRESKLLSTTVAEPYLGDYVEWHHIRKMDRKNCKEEMMNLRTWICKRIAGDNLELWWRIPPSWLNGSKMLLLSDLVSPEPNAAQLIKAKPTIGNDSNEMEQSVCGFCREVIHYVPDEEGGQHPVEHRVKLCSWFEGHRKEMTELVDEYGADKLFSNKMTCQRALNILTRCALGRE
jgi:hypothetical protein